MWLTTRPEKKKNVEFVYHTMKTMYEQTKNWKKSLPFEAIQLKVNNILKNNHSEPMNPRTLHRYLNTLLGERPPRVFRTGKKGPYTIDYAREQAEKENQFNEMFSVDDYRKIRIVKTKKIDGQKYDIPKGSLFLVPEIKNISEFVENWRRKMHGNKEIARAETFAWINSFASAITFKSEVAGTNIAVRPEKLVTTDEKIGVNAFIFRKSMEIMFELLQSLDLGRLKKDDNSYLGDAQLSVTINFDPRVLFQTLLYNRDRAEFDLNSERIPSKIGGVQLIPNKTVDKPVFPEIFKDIPNTLMPN